MDATSPPSSSRRRLVQLREADEAAWAHYVRHVTPAAGRSHPPLVAPPSLPVQTAEGAAGLSLPLPSVTVRPRAVASFLVIGSQPGGVDSSTWHRFHSGKLAASRTLDLHGRTAHRAFQALSHFLHGARADRVRCVEVITGRGSGEAGGVLRRELPLWLNLPELRPLVLAAAHPHAANPGSVRILLRRTRPEQDG